MKNRVPCGMRRHPVFISDGWLAKFDSDATAAGKGDLQLGVGGDEGLGDLVALGILVPGGVLAVGVDGGGVLLAFGQGELREVDGRSALILVGDGTDVPFVLTLGLAGCGDVVALRAVVM